MKDERLQLLALPDAELYYARGFLGTDEAEHFFQALENKVAWRRDEITLFGRPVAVPRLQAWYGDPGTDYRYSGLDLSPEPWFDELQALRERVSAACETPFNSVLINYYRNGSDGVGWHRDNEQSLGPRPVIASLSLGQSRRFSLRHRDLPEHKLQLELNSGDLLIMAGATQHHWLHAIPKSRRQLAPRINLSFRYRIPGPGG
ncbi:alpha-ketoglutarate-dependent dioxygenase AlkB [Motiliproteus sp. SC1-56]|uniref:alpha-ketoglutarate-dependent dioxygenase AlkB family protein n=1 Tax=Motiliproteus sp. SC1-56 TaxID=2799565 RepID=UPI001A8DAE70|nr:alpha-ketoglutarate-dependent dioxygenase AlkB [Motiliproteus sp. SC1-56]